LEEKRKPNQKPNQKPKPELKLGLEAKKIQNQKKCGKVL